MLQIVRAQSSADFAHARDLFKEYAASLGFDLCFQDFEHELESLPEQYGAPYGCLLLAKEHAALCGCIALRKFGARDSELKRLFVRPDYRARGIGKALTLAILEEARKLGYQRVLLDTVPSMTEAIALYRSLGFCEISPYYATPISGAIFMELTF